jgi:hypothetical protein
MDGAKPGREMAGFDATLHRQDVDAHPPAQLSRGRLDALASHSVRLKARRVVVVVSLWGVGTGVRGIDLLVCIAMVENAEVIEVVQRCT